MKASVKFTLKPIISIDVDYDDISVKGNALASGDDDLDKKVEDEILRRRRNGDIWAWCCVTVRASWHGFVGTDFLGGCSYESETDFKNGDYYPEMVVQAKADLKKKVEAAAAAILNDLEYTEN
jgi:hypothetical protein